MQQGGTTRGGSVGHGWPSEDEPSKPTQQLLLDDRPKKGKPPAKAPRNGKRWEILVERFSEGAGSMFLRPGAIIDRGTVIALNRLVDDLRVAGVTQAEVRDAGRICAERFQRPVTVRWLMKPGNLIDLVTKIRAGEAADIGDRKFKVLR